MNTFQFSNLKQCWNHDSRVNNWKRLQKFQLIFTHSLFQIYPEINFDIPVTQYPVMNTRKIIGMPIFPKNVSIFTTVSSSMVYFS